MRRVLQASRRCVRVALASVPRAPAPRKRASIVGLVRDSIGAVMPGVTVEAASPALIEKVRSAVDRRHRAASPSSTSARALHRHVHAARLQDRPARRHRARRRVRRDGERRARGRRARGDVTVTGASPVVDLQSTQNQFVANREVLDVLPATRSMQGGASLVPGVSFYSQGFVEHDVGARVGVGRPAHLLRRHAHRPEPDRHRQPGQRHRRERARRRRSSSTTPDRSRRRRRSAACAWTRFRRKAATVLGRGARLLLERRRSRTTTCPTSCGRSSREGDRARLQLWNANADVRRARSSRNRLWFFTAFRLSQTDNYVREHVLPRRRAGEPRCGKMAPHGTLRLTGAAQRSSNKLRCAYYNSQGGTQRYDVGCTATSGNRVSCMSRRKRRTRCRRRCSSRVSQVDVADDQPPAARGRRSRSASRPTSSATSPKTVRSTS